MMHNAPETLKFKRLVRRLRKEIGDGPVSAETVVAGLLERMWHIAIRDPELQDGAIGKKLTPEDLAELVGWLRDPQLLFDALIAERWLDKSESAVFSIHDWDVHKPNFLKGVAARRLRRNELGDLPSSQPSTELGQQLSNELGADPSIEPANDTKQNTTQPDITKPNQTQQNQIKQINPAAASQLAAAARFDFSRFADTPDQRELARLAAERLHKVAGKVLTREFIWSVAWISEVCVRGFCTEMHDKIRAGGVKNYRRYVERALDGELGKLGLTYSSCSEHVPTIGKRESVCA